LPQPAKKNIDFILQARKGIKRMRRRLKLASSTEAK